MKALITGISGFIAGNLAKTLASDGVTVVVRDVDSGAELWKARLPAGAQATPMTYRLRSDSRQMVVIAAGGHERGGAETGDAIVAFALPR